MLEVKWLCCVCVSVVYVRVFALHSAVHCCARHSFHFISFHFISFHFISFHFISFHFISFHFISFHFIFISFHFISFHFISFHFISFHFISFHFISFHFISFHFISFHLGFRAKDATCTCVSCACAIARGCCALSVCVLWCMWSLFARGVGACRSPGAEARRTPHFPTLRVDTFPPRRDHIHPHTTCLSSTDLQRKTSTEDPGAPLLCAVCVSPSSQQPPGSGAARSRKNSEATCQDGKLLAANA